MAESTSLLRTHTRKGIEGSNPSLSVNLKAPDGAFFCLRKERDENLGSSRSEAKGMIPLGITRRARLSVSEASQSLRPKKSLPLGGFFFGKKG